MVSTTTFLASAVLMSALALLVAAAAEVTSPGRSREPTVGRRRPWVGFRLVRSSRAWFLLAVGLLVVTLIAVLGYVIGDVESLVGVAVPGALTVAAGAAWLLTGQD